MPAAQEIEFLVREKGSQEVKRYAVADELRSAAVDRFDFDQGEVLVSLAGRAYFAGYGVAWVESVVFDLLLGYIDIVRGVEVVVVG